MENFVWENLECRMYKLVFGIFLLAGSITYAIKMRGMGYLDYVQFKGSNWPIVFLWASSPFVTICALQKKYTYSVVGCIPFIFFALYLQVRSFALLSLVPVCVIFFLQQGAPEGVRKKLPLLKLTGGIILVSMLLLLSAAVTYLKVGRIVLPDAGIPYGMAIVFQETIKKGVYTGWVSLTGYLLNFLVPFFKLFHLRLPHIVDTPVYMARLIDGVPKWTTIYYHYPALWYADAFVSFGKAGVVLGLLWGSVFSFFECLIRRNVTFLGIFIPFFMWHVYMILRGAIAIASVPFSYAFYVQMMVIYVVSIIANIGTRRP